MKNFRHNKLQTTLLNKKFFHQKHQLFSSKKERETQERKTVYFFGVRREPERYWPTKPTLVSITMVKPAAIKLYPKRNGYFLRINIQALLICLCSNRHKRFWHNQNNLQIP